MLTKTGTIPSYELVTHVSEGGHVALTSELATAINTIIKARVYALDLTNDVYPSLTLVYFLRCRLKESRRE